MVPRMAYPHGFRCWYNDLVTIETVNTNILITYRNSDRKIMPYIRITSRPPWE